MVIMWIMIFFFEKADDVYSIHFKHLLSISSESPNVSLILLKWSLLFLELIIASCSMLDLEVELRPITASPRKYLKIYQVLATRGDL